MKTFNCIQKEFKTRARFRSLMKESKRVRHIILSDERVVNYQLATFE